MARFAAFRFTVDASPSQVVVLGRHVGAARFAFNQCLAMVKDALDAKAKSADGLVRVPWTGFDLINSFNGWKRSAAAGRVWVVDSAGQATLQSTGLRWRAEVCQQVFEEAAVDCGRALAGFADSRKGKRRGRVGFPRFKRKSATVASFRIRNKVTAGRAAIRVGDGDAGPRTISLPKIGVVRVREDTRRLRRMLRGGRATIRYVTVSQRAGRWSVSVTVEAADLHSARRHPAAADGEIRGWVGVDRGLTALVVAADRTGREVLRVEPPRPLRTSLPRLRRLSRRVSRAQRGSNNRRRAVVRLARCHRRIGDVRVHALHEVANRLVKTHDRLVLEDLNTRGMVKNRRLARSIADAGWAQLARMVGYKQQWAGGRVVMADRWFASSKTCSKCGTAVGSLSLSQRVFNCTGCGHVADRDLNAAANLAVWGEQHDAQTRDPEARGPVINALPRGGSDRRASARR